MASAAATAFNKEVFTELGVGILVVSLRTYTRWSSVGFARFMLDDYLMLLAVTIYGFETWAAYSVGHVFHGLANNSMTDEYRHALAPDSEEYLLRVGGSKLQLMGWSSYTALLWILKLCMCVFYTRLTTGLQHMRMRTTIGFVLIGVTYVVTITAILAACGSPFRRNWQIWPDPGNACQPAVSKYDLFFTVVLNVLTDAYLISIPLPMVWKAQIPARRKAQLLLLFSGGIFVMAAGILRCVLILTAGPNGAQQAGSWAVRETFVAVVIGNLPMIQPLFTRTARKLGSGLSSFGGGSAPPSMGSTPLKDYPRRHHHHKAAAATPRTANPLTLSSSQEYIVEERRLRKSMYGPGNREEEEEEEGEEEVVVVGGGGGGRRRMGGGGGGGGDKGGIHVASETVVDYESVRTGEDDEEENNERRRIGVAVGGPGGFQCSVSA